MKRQFMIWCLMLGMAAGTLAQEMRVESFRLLPTDLTAMTRGTQKTDGNGEVAALIKVVSPIKGFTFSGGSLGIVGSNHDHAGETWVYVPRYAQKLTIAHRDLGMLRDYAYPITIEGGKTYELLLDVGTGRFVTIETQMANADVTIDGQYAGRAPILNRYLTFKPHDIVAVSGHSEGTLLLEVTPETQRGAVVNVPMRDLSFMYGDVTVSVADRADIIFQGRKVGTGTWRTQLKEGSYFVETIRENCDTARTSFSVKRGEQNSVQATTPTPHTGYLNIYTRPRNVQAIYDGRTPIDLSATQPLPVGRHELQFSKKGYVGQTHSYDIVRNQTTRDTVTLERVTYVRPLAFYFGGGYTIQQLGGLTAVAGAVFHRHDLQLSYTFGTSQSDPVYWYNEAGLWLCTMSYKQNSLALHYGYQLNLMRQLGITPQVGYRLDMLSAHTDDGSGTYGDGGKAACLTVGMKLLLVPMQHCYVFVQPEYAIALSQNAYFKQSADIGNFAAGGFGLSMGVLLSF